MTEPTMWSVLIGAVASFLGAVALWLRTNAKRAEQREEPMPSPPPMQREPTGSHPTFGYATHARPHAFVHTSDQLSKISIDQSEILALLHSVQRQLTALNEDQVRGRVEMAEAARETQDQLRSIKREIRERDLQRAQRSPVPPPLPATGMKGK